MSRAERVERLAAARLYLCTDARSGPGDLEAFLDAVLTGGVDVVQLRQKGMEAADELAALDVVARACARHGALVAVNDRADIAYACQADVLHLGQDDLPVHVAREIVGADMLIGRSSHAATESDAAMVQDGVDYVAVGPCWPTPTKPGRPAPGLGLVRHVAQRFGVTDRPWFAIGGIDTDTLPQVLEAGANRVVVVRVLTQATDPQRAARALSQTLRSASFGATANGPASNGSA
ncbi:MAG: thiamine phosphate synthase [Candidatus Nanopelagicales bacterium]